MVLFIKDLANTHSPEETVHVVTSAGTSYMGAELGAAAGAPFGPLGMATGAAAGSTVESVIEDPVGFVDSSVHCIFGGYCGDIPYELTRSINFDELREHLEEMKKTK